MILQRLIVSQLVHRIGRLLWAVWPDERRQGFCKYRHCPDQVVLRVRFWIFVSFFIIRQMLNSISMPNHWLDRWSSVLGTQHPAGSSKANRCCWNGLTSIGNDVLPASGVDNLIDWLIDLYSVLATHRRAVMPGGPASALFRGTHQMSNWPTHRRSH